MAVRSDYVTGTITLTNGSAAFSGTGTGWLAGGFREGDTIFDVTGATEFMGVIEAITTNGAGTLTQPWEGPTLGPVPYRMRYQPDGSRIPAQAAQLVEMLGNGNLLAFAELDGSAGNLLPMFDGSGSMVLITRTELVSGVAYDVQVDLLADRALYDAQSEGYSVLVSDIGDGRAAVYSKNSATSGDWSDPAYVTGPVGPLPTIEAGTTTTLTPGSAATVDVVPVTGGYEINFGIPEGDQGIQGIPGPEGAGLEIDASGPFASRSTYDAEAAGFVFLATDTGDLYIRETAVAGVWSSAIPFQAPPTNIITTDDVGDGTAGPYTLDADPTGGSIIGVTVGGVAQYDYVIVADEITFGLSVPVGVPWQVKSTASIVTGIPSNDSVGADQIDGTEAAAIRAKIGAGDVDGPAGGTVDNGFVLFADTTGKLIKTVTVAVYTALLNAFTGDSGAGGLKGLVPAPVAGDATKFLRGDATWANAVSPPERLPTLSNSSGDLTNDIAFTAGTAWDSTDTVKIVCPALIKQLDVDWAPGNNAGGRNSVAIANTMYRWFVVAKAGGADPDYFAHTSDTIATVLAALQAMPGGASYIYARRLGNTVRASNSIRLFNQVGDHFNYVGPVADTDVTITTARTLCTATVVPPGATAKLRAAAYHASANTLVVAVPTSESDIAVTAGNASPGVSIVTQVSNVNVPVALELQVDASSQYAVRSSAATTQYRAVTWGYIDTRGRY